MVMHGLPIEMQLGAGPGTTALSTAGWKPHDGFRSTPLTRHGLKSTPAPRTASPLPGPTPEGPLSAPHQLRSASCAGPPVVLSRPAETFPEIELSLATRLAAAPPT